MESFEREALRVFTRIHATACNRPDSAIDLFLNRNLASIKSRGHAFNNTILNTVTHIQFDSHYPADRKCKETTRASTDCYDLNALADSSTGWVISLQKADFRRLIVFINQDKSVSIPMS
ncbi:hypothetical protein BaRGS_00013864 [Batillaria attramentaria]|uniref:Uncharacterized protein n=1 Tax=Batillaria attramentaria TaxID=370345 RepID=A0ABD0L6I6_9CAEN